ncbi:MAG: alpha/beta fold hydrolase [Solobacterium sp.]|nr:alpha/beta fold hydrolase [Solobacterium sp.]
MALLHIDFESQYTGHNEDVYVVMPDKKRSETPAEFYGKGTKYPVLWLLHGTFGGYSDWIRKSNIETYACEHDCIVVMMGVGNSSYEAWPGFTIGYDSCKYIIDELMPMVYNWLPASDKREDNFIAGLSMGGGGTFKLAVNFPEKFAAAAVLSAPPRDLDSQKEELEALFKKTRKELMDDPTQARNLRTYNSIHRFDSVEDYLNDPLCNAYRKFHEQLKAGTELPKFMFAIGTEDGMYEGFKAWKAHLADIGFDAEFHEGPGRHEWRVWERDIQTAFKFFGFGDEEQGNIF